MKRRNMIIFVAILLFAFGTVGQEQSYWDLAVFFSGLLLGYLFIPMEADKK